MPINPMIPLMAGQGVPQVKSLSDVMTDVARIKTAEATVRRMDAITAQEAERARQEQEKRERMAKADGIAKLYANDEGQIGAKLREAGMLEESVAYDQFLGQHRERTAKAIQDGLESQKAVLAMTAPVLDQITDERSYSLATAMIEGYERLNPQAKGGLSEDLKRMSYQEAVESGMLDKMRNFVKAQASNAAAQQDAFKTFAAAMNTAGDLDSLYATVTSQQELDGLNQSLAALRIPADLRNAYPTVYTPGMEETFAKRVAARQNTKAQGAATPGTRAEYLAKYLPPNATQADYDATIKRFEALNDPNQGADVAPLVLTRRPYEEEQNDIIPGGTLTKKAVWENAIEYALTNTVKQNPRSSDPKERVNFNAIENARAALIKDDASLPQIQALYAALNQGQKAMMKQYLNTSAFVDSALRGLDQVDRLSKEYDRTQVPVINDMRKWWGQNISGDKSLSELEVFVFNAARDYAKATSGSAGSVQQMTDAQIKASELLFSLRQSPEAFKAAAESMRADMQNQVGAQRRKLDETNTGILELLEPGAKKPWLPDGGKKPAPNAGDNASLTATTSDGRTVTFPSMAARDAAVKESGGQLKVVGAAPAAPEKVDYIWDPATKTMKKVGG